MINNPTDYTHIRVTKGIRQKLNITAARLDVAVIRLIERLIDEEISRLDSIAATAEEKQPEARK